MESSIVALLAIIIALLIWLTMLAFQMRNLLQGIDSSLQRLTLNPSTRHHGHHDLKNFSIWTSRGGRWALVEEHCEPGYMSGDPPRRAGAYEGETVRKPAVRRS